MDRTRIFLIGIIVLLAGTSGWLGYLHFASAIPAPSRNSTCEPGSCTVEPCSEIAYVDSSGPTYLVRDNTGVGIYSSTNPTTVLNNLLSDVSSKSETGCLSAGTYALGTSGISVATTPTNWGLVFEEGASITYSGTGFAIQIAPTGGACCDQDFTILYPSISLTSACGSDTAAIELGKGTTRFQLVDPTITSNCIGIQFDGLNTGKIIGGGRIIDSGNVRAAGTIGIALAAFPAITTTSVNNIEIDINQISSFEHGVQLGSKNLQDFFLQATLDNIYFSNNKDAVEYYAGNTLELWRDYFELQTEASLNITNTGTNTPSYVDVLQNIFVENAGINDVNCPINTAILVNSYLIGNNWGAGNINLACTAQKVTIDITGAAGTVTISGSPASSSVEIIFMPSPQSGKVTAISTASTGLQTGSVTFQQAFPSGLNNYFVTLTLLSPSDSTTRFGGIWATSVSNTGFTWNIAVTTAGAGGSTVSIVWTAQIGMQQ